MNRHLLHEAENRTSLVLVWSQSQTDCHESLGTRGAGSGGRGCTGAVPWWCSVLLQKRDGEPRACGRLALGFASAAPSCSEARESQSCCDAAYGAPWWSLGGGQESLGEGRGMHINHYWRTSQLLSQAVACCCSWCSPDINHNSPTIDPFAAAIRKSVLVLSIF